MLLISNRNRFLIVQVASPLAQIAIKPYSWRVSCVPYSLPLCSHKSFPVRQPGGLLQPHIHTHTHIRGRPSRGLLLHTQWNPYSSPWSPRPIGQTSSVTSTLITLCFAHHIEANQAFCSSDTPPSFPPSGLCTCSSLCQECGLPALPTAALAPPSILYSNVSNSNQPFPASCVKIPPSLYCLVLPFTLFHIPMFLFFTAFLMLCNFFIYLLIEIHVSPLEYKLHPNRSLSAPSNLYSPSPNLGVWRVTGAPYLFNEWTNCPIAPLVKIIHSTNRHCSNSKITKKCKLLKIWFSMLTSLWGENVLPRQHRHFCPFDSEYFFLEKFLLRLMQQHFLDLVSMIQFL